MPNRKADTFNYHCIKALSGFNKDNLKTLTVDRGKEFAGYLVLENILLYYRFILNAKKDSYF